MTRAPDRLAAQLTGKVGVQWKPDRAKTFYATFSTGYKGQAYDLTSTFNAAIAATMPVPAETAES